MDEAIRKFEPGLGIGYVLPMNRAAPRALADRRCKRKVAPV